MVCREASPSTAVIDSHSVKVTESGGCSGYDVGKRIKGRKRHILTDTDGNLLHGVIHTADTQDRDGAPLVLREIIKCFPCCGMCSLMAAMPATSCGGRCAEATLEIIKRSDTAKGFEVLLRRWEVERTFAWLNGSRRLARDFEQIIASATAWLFVASIRLFTRRATPCSSGV